MKFTYKFIVPTVVRLDTNQILVALLSMNDCSLKNIFLFVSQARDNKLCTIFSYVVSNSFGEESWKTELEQAKSEIQKCTFYYIRDVYIDSKKHMVYDRVSIIVIFP